MIVKKVSRKTVKLEKIESVNCDWCRSPLYAPKERKERKLVASLTFSSVSLDEMDGVDGFNTEHVRHESSEFCADCYDKLLDFMLSKGAKVPSFMLDTSGMDDEDVNVDDGKH